MSWRTLEGRVNVCRGEVEEGNTTVCCCDVSKRLAILCRCVPRRCASVRQQDGGSQLRRRMRWEMVVRERALARLYRGKTGVSQRVFLYSTLPSSRSMRVVVDGCLHGTLPGHKVADGRPHGSASAYVVAFGPGRHNVLSLGKVLKRGWGCGGRRETFSKVFLLPPQSLSSSSLKKAAFLSKGRPGVGSYAAYFLFSSASCGNMGV